MVVAVLAVVAGFVFLTAKLNNDTTPAAAPKATDHAVRHHPGGRRVQRAAGSPVRSSQGREA